MQRTCLGVIAATALALPIPAVGAACYVPDVEASTLSFTAMQRDEPFEGRFQDFTGTLCLDPAAPETGRIDLMILTGSVESGLPEADQALRSALFLDAAAHPEAVFRSRAIRPLGADRFEVTGDFSLRDGVRELTVPFEFRPAHGGDGWLLEGETSIRRLDYGVGIGEWLDTEFLDDEIRLSFSVKLRAPD
jgi:polyisoprenoid-binding protein YceI